MVVPMKLTGFSVFSKAEEVMTFLKKARLKDFELFLSLEPSGEKKNSFTGTTYILVKSEFDVASVMRLRGQRVGRNYIDISRCSIRELKSANLYPTPSPLLFEEMESLSPIHKSSKSQISKSRIISHVSNENYDSHKRKIHSVSLYEPQLDQLKKHNKEDYRSRSPSPIENFIDEGNRSVFVSDNYRKPAPIISRITSNNNVEKPKIIVPIIETKNQLGYRPSDHSKTSSIPFDCYIKLFYIGADVSKQDVFNFFESVSFPVDIIYSFFDSGPYSGKPRGEAFILFSSPKEALKSMHLNNETLGLSRVALVFPTLEEIETVIYQNEQKLKKTIEPPPLPNANNKPSVNEKDELAYSLLNVVTNILAKNSTNATKGEATMVDEQVLRNNIVDNVPPKYPEPQKLLTYIQLRNVSSQVSNDEIKQFFKEFRYDLSSLKRKPIVPGKRSTEWEIGFEDYQEALTAIRKLNYQLLNYQPVELSIM